MRFDLLLLVCSLLVAVQTTAQQPRPLAPGVLEIIPPNIDTRDSYSLPMPLIGLDAQAYSPNYVPVLNTLRGQSQNVVFFRDVWHYEFGFLGLRQIELTLPTVNGPQKQNVWYLIYRIRNTGSNLSYQQVQEDQRFEHVRNELQRNREDFKINSRFIPHFYLNGWVQVGDQYQQVSYRDQIDPESLRLIRLQEDAHRYLMDKVEMMNAKFPLASSTDDGGFWGVAIWHNVDPRIDYVSVKVRGLTNAFRISNSGDGKREFHHRTLQLNFWRPGDPVREKDDRIDFGIPLVDDPVKQVEITRRYQLPGPLLRGYFISPDADQNVLVAELDAEINLENFKSALIPILDAGKLPPKIAAQIAKSGFEIPPNVAVKTDIRGQKWSFDLGDGNEEEGIEPTRFFISLEPQYWEPDSDGIRFIKSLDHLWIYE